VAAAHAVVAVSSFGRSQLYRWVGYRHWEKVRVVHCAVDDGWLAAPPTPIPAGCRRLVCVGRLCEQKGQALLVRAAARLAREGVAFELLLVGDGEMRDALEELIAASGVGGQVAITGWADGEGVRRQLAAARALVLASFAEGLPVVLMEAFALGRPVIATAIAGIPELVADAESGWLVTPGDVDALAEAMRQALHADVADLERMGLAGREAVAARHRAAVEAGKLQALFAPTGSQEPA
jgi:glycosyltransferase involved in cell wall biosynthesis